jgi:predicted ATPase
MEDRARWNRYWAPSIAWPPAANGSSCWSRAIPESASPRSSMSCRRCWRAELLLFPSGKFDQYRRDVPYSTLVQAFQSLVRTLLSMSEAELAGWRVVLADALASEAQLMTDLIPELKLVIGASPPLRALPSQQAQRRFQLVVRRFIGVFATKAHPLVLFLDDLQWVDMATLDLLADLLTRPDRQYLLLIAAFRDQEVDADHPFTSKLETIIHAGAKVDEIVLEPLALKGLQQLIAEALCSESQSVASLAELVHQKTAGNPFFATQFLSALAEENLLTFDHRASSWSWDLNRIHAKGYTENVVDLMVAKLNRLPNETRSAVQHLACIGSGAEAAMLAAVLELSQEEAEAALRPAIRYGLVDRVTATYRFAHDRVQEAAYSLIPAKVRAKFHLRIGRFFLAQTPPEQREEAIFEIVN